MKVAHCRPTASFGAAFAAARRAHCDAFWWQGRRYHTRRADDPSHEEPIIDWIREEPAES